MGERRRKREGGRQKDAWYRNARVVWRKRRRGGGVRSDEVELDAGSGEIDDPFDERAACEVKRRVC